MKSYLKGDCLSNYLFHPALYIFIRRYFAIQICFGDKFTTFIVLIQQNRFLELGDPATLARWGVDRRAVARLTDLTMAERKANLDVNPVPCDQRAVTALLSAVTE